MIVDLEQLLAIVDVQLCNDDNRFENNAMNHDIVSKDLLQRAKLFEPSIDRLLTCKKSAFALPFIFCFVVNWGSYVVILASVSFVGFNHLPISQHLLQFLTKDCNIWIVSTREGAIDMNNVTGTDSKGDFIAETRPFELVAVPSRRKWRRLVNLEVSTIHRDHAVAVIGATI